jgi:steroid delta-isomerase-like uncharacterized protein
MSAENKALLQRWFDEVWNDGRLATVDELLAEDAVIHAATGDLRGPVGFKPFHAAYRNAFPDVRLRLDQVVAEGDLVAARWTAAGTHGGDGLGMAATGRRAEFQGMVFARIRDGRFVEGWDCFDQYGMLQQLGLLPAPGA